MRLRWQLAVLVIMSGCKLLRRDAAKDDSDAWTTFAAPSSVPASSDSATSVSPDPSAVASVNDVASAAPSASVIDPRQAARLQAIHDAQEFGMIGILGGDGGSVAPWGREEVPIGTSNTATLGQGTIGTLGSRTTTGSIRMGTMSVNGRLPPEVIQRVVRQNFGRFRLCYSNGLRSNPSLQGRVSTKIIIGRDGSVQSAQNSGSDMPDQGVVDCVVRGFGNLSFPQPEGGIVTVITPIIFSPSS